MLWNFIKIIFELKQVKISDYKYLFGGNWSDLVLWYMGKITLPESRTLLFVIYRLLCCGVSQTPPASKDEYLSKRGKLLTFHFSKLLSASMGRFTKPLQSCQCSDKTLPQPLVRLLKKTNTSMQCLLPALLIRTF